MSDFELHITDSDEQELIAYDTFSESLLTQIPESTKAVIAKQNASPLNVIKTVTLASAFVLHLSTYNPVQAKQYIH